MQFQLLLLPTFLPSLSLCSALIPRQNTNFATINFENGIAAPTALIPVGIEGNLYFKSFTRLQVGETPLGGARPKSGTNVASTSFRTRITNNLPVLNPIDPLSSLIAPQPLITTSYPLSANDRADFDSLYLTCAGATALGVAGVLSPCRVRFEAIRPDGSVKGVEVVDYSPATDSPVDVEEMMFVKFNNDFVGIKEVKVFLESGLTGVELVDGFVTAVIIDNIKVRVRNG